jgi:hypothetical protein
MKWPWDKETKPSPMAQMAVGHKPKRKPKAQPRPPLSALPKEAAKGTDRPAQRLRRLKQFIEEQSDLGVHVKLLRSHIAEYERRVKAYPRVK